MRTTAGFEAHCADCDAAYHWAVVDPTARERKAHERNRDVWAANHYDITGHHRFRYSNVNEFDVSMAVVPDPNQLRLSDDPNYSTFTLGPEA
jgi:hypothetical protein